MKSLYNRLILLSVTLLVGHLSLAQGNLDSGFILKMPFNGNFNYCSEFNIDLKPTIADNLDSASFTRDRYGNKNSAMHFEYSDSLTVFRTKY